MIRRQPLLRTPLVEVVSYDHPEGMEHSDPATEVAPRHAISFIERGAFDLYHAGRRWRMGPGSLFVTHPGFAYRCSHDEACPNDVSLSVQYSPALVEDVQRTTGRRWARAAPAASLTNRLAYLRHQLIEAARGREGSMSADAVAGDLLAALDEGGSRPGRLFGPSLLAWYARRIEEAREMMAERFAEPISLEAVARGAGMSPYHFSRVFRELVGLPPHRYLVRVRLARAAQRLRQGAGVTETCYATGFNNLGHFIRTFRRAYGVPPSRLGC
jgi:AraC family transcriptional regulator